MSACDTYFATSNYVTYANYERRRKSYATKAENGNASPNSLQLLYSYCRRTIRTSRRVITLRKLITNVAEIPPAFVRDTSSENGDASSCSLKLLELYFRRTVPISRRVIMLRTLITNVTEIPPAFVRATNSENGDAIPLVTYLSRATCVRYVSRYE